MTTLRHSHRVEISPYTERWPTLFEREKAAIVSAIGRAILDVQHVGSTSVPGLVAKPIIDIGIAVEDFVEAKRCVVPLEEVGYIYRGENGIPRRHYFVKREPYAVHVHMNEIHSDDWRMQIVFRDALRASPKLRAEYAALKQTLAQAYPESRLAYTDSKNGFITHVLLQSMPSLLPEAGQSLLVRAFKADGTCYRWWPATVAASSAAGIVMLSQIGHTVWDLNGSWQARHEVQTYYWFDRPYNLLEVYAAEGGNLLEIYVNVSSPARLKDGELHFNDYELDVTRTPGQPARVVDEDEFAEAARAFNYPEGFQRLCYDVAQRAVVLADRWDVRQPHALKLSRHR